MNFIERLENVLKINNMTAKELTIQLEIGRTAVNDWKRGKSTPSPNILIGISHILHVSLDWLLTGEGDMYKNPLTQNMSVEESELLENYKKLNKPDQIRILERIKTIVDMKEETEARILKKTKPPKEQPKLTLVRSYEEDNQNEFEEMDEMMVMDLDASAGIGNYLEQDSTYELISFKRNDIPYGTDYGIRISGNSMEPLIHHKEIVWIKEQAQIENGQIGIFVLDNESYCKKLKIDYENRKVWLVSLNEEYKPILVTEDRTLKTVGRVLI